MSVANTLSFVVQPYVHGASERFLLHLFFFVFHEKYFKLTLFAKLTLNDNRKSTLPEQFEKEMHLFLNRKFWFINLVGNVAKKLKESE